MTVVEKRDKVKCYCDSMDCPECVLNKAENNWCLKYSIGCCSEEALDEAIKLISESNESEPIPTESTEPVSDNVNHPSHYTNGMECIDEMIMIFGIDAVITFCKLNVWKYRKRALNKNGQEDMDKSDWYINKYQELQGRLNNVG